MGLFDLFFNNNNKPKSSGITSIVKRDFHEQQQAAKMSGSANVQVRKSNIGTAITDNAQKILQRSQEAASSGGGGSSSGGGDSGSSGDGDSSSDGGMTEEEKQKAAEEKAKKLAYKKAMASIAHMKDSNVKFQYKNDFNDLWNQATVQKQKDFWDLKEEVFLYTFHDKQRHRYLESISIDADKGDIMYTSQVTFPFDQKLMEYWIPGKTTFAIVGGTYDREILFVGRVSEVNQRGQTIEMVGQNIGWKFKSYMTQKFQKSLENLTVKNAVKLIFKQLGFTKGRYHIDLSGIPNINNYKMGEDGDVLKNGQQVQNVPELKDVVKNLKSYDIDKYIEKKSKTREVQKSADDYEEKKKMTSIDWVTNSSVEFYPSSARKIYGISTEYDEKNEELLYTPILSKIQGKQELEDYLVKGYSGGGDYTYEDILTNIASAIDAHFFIVDTTVCFMSFNALIANSSIVQKAVTPEIEPWQLQDGSYTLDLNQYGFYNTVEIKYKHGTITKSYDDLVRVFGVVKVKYNEPKLDYDAAMLKAQAYLSAHIRDFGMELKATILYSGKILPANFIKLTNPLTMSEGLFFIQGTSVQWSADNQTLICDLDLRFGPENPDGLEVPEAGTSYSGGGSSSGTTASANVSASISKAAQEIIQGCQTDDDKAFAIYDWVDKYVKYEFYYGKRHGPTEMLTRKMGNCYDTAYLIYDLCSAVGVKCEVWNGTYKFLDGTWGHLWNKIYYQGEMKFADTGYGTTGSIKRNPIGSYHGGKVLSGSCVAKNY